MNYLCNHRFKKELNTFITKMYPQLNVTIISRNNFTIGNYWQPYCAAVLSISISVASVVPSIVGR